MAVKHSTSRKAAPKRPAPAPRYRWPTDPKRSKPSHTISWNAHLSHKRERTGPTPSRQPGSQPIYEGRTVNAYGQMISFGIESGGDQRFSGTTTVTVKKGLDTVRKICKDRVHPDMERRVLALNGIKNPNTKLKINRRIRVPDRLRESQRFHVLAGDQAPRVVGGYAKIDVVDRTERSGISVFRGYDPIVLEVPVRFEAEDRSGPWGSADGTQIERDIRLLEQMAGRGIHQGAAVGAPPIIQVMTRDNSGNFVGLIPKAYQYTRGNPLNQLWWVSGIDWDPDGQRNDDGQRIRQLATITLTQYVTPDQLVPSAAERAKSLRSQKPPKKGAGAKHTVKGRNA
jgi:hypothetical protein